MKRYVEGEEVESIKRVRDFPFDHGTFISLDFPINSTNIQVSFSYEWVTRLIIEKCIFAQSDVSVYLGSPISKQLANFENCVPSEKSQVKTISSREMHLNYCLHLIYKNVLCQTKPPTKIQKYQKNWKLPTGNFLSTPLKMKMEMGYDPRDISFENCQVILGLNSKSLSLRYLNKFISELHFH